MLDGVPPAASIDKVAAAAAPMAITRALAAMQTNIMTVALPLFNRDIDRFAVYVLALRQSFRATDGGTPMLAMANSLGLPAETTRRHVMALMASGLCRRDAGGVVATEAWEDDPAVRDLLVLSHDCFVRLVEDLRSTMTMPAQGRTQAYDWKSGVQAAADLMLAVAEGNRAVHRDWLDLVLFSTVLHVNYRDAGPYAGRPAIATARLARTLSLSKTTVQRHVARMCGHSLEAGRDGLRVSERWMASDEALRTSAESYGNIRRILASLEARGFPFDQPASAYRVGRPALPMID